jgi:hypothetical protein
MQEPIKPIPFTATSFSSASEALTYLQKKSEP